MKIINNINQMQGKSERLRDQDNRIGFVPTMGFLHEGHMSLISKAREESSTLVVSVFVNPTQFGPNEDLRCYPRDFERDADLCRGAGVDVLFFPSEKEMYPEGFRTEVAVPGLSDVLCGRSRPGHFDGVATVVAKLFSIVRPHRAYFGLKDYQQYRIVSRMAQDLNMDIEIVGLPTVREPDGLAMSSRNTYLSSVERNSALSLGRSLNTAREMASGGTRESKALTAHITKIIESEQNTRIDYIQVVDPKELTPVDTVARGAVIALAVFVGKTRLIDNTLIEPLT